jgi:hypothetical protein
VGLVMFLVAMLGPAAVMISMYENIAIDIIAITWYYSRWGDFILYPPFMWIPPLPATGTRFWLVYEMVRLYRRKVTMGRVKRAAVASEAPFAIMGIIYMIPSFFNARFLFFYAVVPTLIIPLVAWTLMKVKPPPKEWEIWDGHPESVHWWQKTDTATE